jgi:hypothetical protein
MLRIGTVNTSQYGCAYEEDKGGEKRLVLCCDYKDLAFSRCGPRMLDYEFAALSIIYPNVA